MAISANGSTSRLAGHRLPTTMLSRPPILRTGSALLRRGTAAFSLTTPLSTPCPAVIASQTNSVTRPGDSLARSPQGGAASRQSSTTFIIRSRGAPVRVPADNCCRCLPGRRGLLPGLCPSRNQLLPCSQYPRPLCLRVSPGCGFPPDGGAMDFAAWMEVWLGDRWYTLDPRNNCARRGRVLIGRGRDALDCAMLTTYGNAELETILVWADQVPNETE